MQHIFTENVKKNIEFLFKKARGELNDDDTENDKTSFYQTKPNLFSEATQNSIIEFWGIGKQLHALLDSAKTTAEKERGSYPIPNCYKTSN